MIQYYPFELLPLPYLYDALEPHIDTETLFFHHSRHLKTYVDSLNRLLKPHPEFQEWTLERLLMENKSLPEEIRQDVWNLAGAVYSHQFFFAELTPNSTKLSGKLKDALLLDFDTWEAFYEIFFETALKLFRLRLALAGRRPAGKAESAFSAQSGHAPPERVYSHPQSRSLGARLLSEAQRRPRRLCKSLVPGRKLVRGRTPLPGRAPGNRSARPPSVLRQVRKGAAASI